MAEYISEKHVLESAAVQVEPVVLHDKPVGKAAVGAYPVRQGSDVNVRGFHAPVGVHVVQLAVRRRVHGLVHEAALDRANVLLPGRSHDPGPARVVYTDEPSHGFPVQAAVRIPRHRSGHDAEVGRMGSPGIWIGRSPVHENSSGGFGGNDVVVHADVPSGVLVGAAAADE